MFKETIRQIDQAGVRAMPIVFLISFLMGLVMAYQGALQLEKFGATIFVVDLVDHLGFDGRWVLCWLRSWWQAAQAVPSPRRSGS